MLCARLMTGRWPPDVSMVCTMPRSGACATNATERAFAESKKATKNAGLNFLDAARHPLIRFDLLSLAQMGGNRYTARADVTMKGVKRPIVFPVDLRVIDDRAHLTGAFELNRADFGIGTSGPWNRLVGRQVTVRVALQAQRG